MPIINNPFNGKLNLDVADYRISNGDYIDALNITKDAQGRGQDKVVSNIVGNTLIPFTLPSGENKIIGFYPDKVRNRAYYFLWNSNGYNTILYYDLSNDTITKVLESKTDSDGIDILKFNPSYKVLSVNIYYRDEEGDLLFFNDGNEPPKVINVSDDYGTSWKYEYILVIKAPPVMPPKVVYENDPTVTQNNLRNKLFQFSYRYVYQNNEKSVWSSRSIVPLPQQPSLELTENDETLNARISIAVSTGGIDVKAIELAFRETTNASTSDLFLIESIKKSENNILDNSIYTYKFKNNGIYTTIDVTDTIQLQDWVPQKANASELANGNVLLYAGITEGYDKTNMSLVGGSTNDTIGYYVDPNGLLFFAISNGLDSGAVGTQMKIYVYGTGTNDPATNITKILTNPIGSYCINAINGSGADIGVKYDYFSNTALSIGTLLANISNALIAKGWTRTSLDSVNNVLTMSYAGGFTLYSSGIKRYYTSSTPNYAQFSNSYDSGYQYALQYFDAQGRTIGAQTSLRSSFYTVKNTNPLYNSQFNTYLEIFNRPPLYASYYQVLRSSNTTYSKKLYWISQSAYSSILSPDSTEPRYIYINIDNIQQYNESITSTSGVVSYNFAQGDRIKFLMRYDVANNPITLSDQYDYEILGTVATVEYNRIIAPVISKNIYTATGNFLKIAYPTDDIGGDFQFTGAEDFLHYEILLYNLTNNSAADQRTFYEFGKCFGIGNAGTDNAYHIGDYSTQTPNLSTKAVISTSSGDLFSRQRQVTYGDLYSFVVDYFDNPGGTFDSPMRRTMRIRIGDLVINNTSYEIKDQSSSDVTFIGSGDPQFADTDYFFYNKSLTNSIIVSLDGLFSATFSQYQQEGLVSATFGMYAIICTSTSKYSTSLLNLENNQLVSHVKKDFTLKRKIDVPPNSKVWLAYYCKPNYIIFPYENSLVVSSYNLGFGIVKNSTINIIESSFSDNYNLVTNSNGRPSAIDINAAQTYFPTLIRFGQAYQASTSINGLNRFFYENLDEYDRSFGDVMRLHIRDRYLKVYQKFKVGNVPVLTQIVKDSANNPLQANTDTLINKIQYYAGDYGIGDASTSLAWNNYADYFVDNYRGVVCRLAQDGITPLSIIYGTNAFFVPLSQEYRQELNNGVVPSGQTYMGNPCIYGVFDAYTNKYIIAMEEINRYQLASTTTTTTTAAPVRLNWSNADGDGIDCDLYINGNLQGGGTTSSGYVMVPANSTVIVGQNSSTTSGLLGRFDLTISNTTDSTTLYTNTVYAIVSTYQAVQGYAFVAKPNNAYQITAYGLAPGTTTTTTTTNAPTAFNIDYYVGNQPGGRLVILNKFNTEILSITSNAGSSQSGTIYPSISEAPFTYRGEWVGSGDGNIIKFNVCDSVAYTELYTSPDITIYNTPVSFTPSPTPLYTSVNLVAQDANLPICTS